MEARARLLGHSIHQMLIVFPLGLLAMGVIFDLIFFGADNEIFSAVAYWMIVAGIVGALAAAPFGFADWLKIPRQPVLDQTVAAGWPQFVAMKEGGQSLGLPLTKDLAWGFDEFLRLGTMMFLSEGKPVSIEIPAGNNPNPHGSKSPRGY